LLGDPGGAAGVGHLVAAESEEGGRHDRDGDGAETGAADDEAEDEDDFAGVDAELGEDDGAGEREQEAGQHDGAEADAIVELAGHVPGEEHADALGGEEQAGGEGALAAHLLVVEGQEEQVPERRSRHAVQIASNWVGLRGSSQQAVMRLSTTS
jgi:hypothetical protein